MIKLKKVFECNNCYHQSSKWTGKCVECGSWNSVSEQIINPKKNSLIESLKQPQLLDSISGDKLSLIHI